MMTQPFLFIINPERIPKDIKGNYLTVIWKHP